MNQNNIKTIVPKMQKAEPVFLFMIMVGFSFKLMHWNGAAMLIIIGLSTLAIIYLYTAIWTAQDNQNLKTGLFHKISFLGLAIAMVGILFKTMIWVGGDLQLTAGLFAIGISLIAILFLRNKPDY